MLCSKSIGVRAYRPQRDDGRFSHFRFEHHLGQHHCDDVAGRTGGQRGKRARATSAFPKKLPSRFRRGGKGPRGLTKKLGCESCCEAVTTRSTTRQASSTYACHTLLQCAVALAAALQCARERKLAKTPIRSPRTGRVSQFAHTHTHTHPTTSHRSNRRAPLHGFNGCFFRLSLFRTAPGEVLGDPEGDRSTMVVPNFCSRRHHETTL